MAWPPTGYEKEEGPDGYIDGEDIIWAEIINSMIEHWMEGLVGPPGQSGEGFILLEPGQTVPDDVPEGTPEGALVAYFEEL